MRSLSVVIPCFNESESIPQLETKLLPVINRLRKQNEVEVIFVDDGSTDDTFSKLEATFGNFPSTKIIRHEINRNLGAAIQTGIRHSKGEYVAFLDSDCTYEPSLVEGMMVQMQNGADLVTVSPYHPNGAVVGVPAWRIGLSKSLSRIYRALVGKPIYTFTALPRVYRREFLRTTQSSATDFTWLTEILLKALKSGAVVYELPAELSVRRYGQSKMRTIKTIQAHLKLIADFMLHPRKYAQG